MRSLESPLRLEVLGRPRPQGSVTARPNGTVKYSAALLRWRQSVSETVKRVLERDGAFQVLCGPVVAAVEFRLRTTDITKPPDLDKLVRAVGDALSDAGVWKDDAQVVGWYATKRATLPGELEGVTIVLEW